MSGHDHDGEDAYDHVDDHDHPSLAGWARDFTLG